MAWSKAVEAIANSVSEIAKTVAAYGPNDEGKAVKAAKKAGNKAKSLTAKAYPKCETEKEFQKKIVPLGIAESRVEYNNLRANELKEAYEQAYNQVMQLYHERLTGSATPLGALLQDSETGNNYQKNKGIGCCFLSLAFLGFGTGIYYVVNLFV